MDLEFEGCFLSVPETYRILEVEASFPRTSHLDCAFLLHLFPPAAPGPEVLWIGGPPNFPLCSCNVHSRVN